MTDLKKIGIGTVQFGTHYGISNTQGQTEESEVSKILQTARDYGIRYLDTAPAYGTAEAVLGNNNANDFRIVSKFMPEDEGAGVEKQLEKSLENLRQKSLYGYIAHRPLSLLNNRDEWDISMKLKAEGRVKKIGFSLNSPRELEQLLEKGIHPDLVQVPYNYFDRRFEKIIRQLKDTGCEVHTRSVFLQGLFFTEPKQLAGFFDEVKPGIEKLQQSVQNLAGSMLAFVLGKPFIDTVITGVENSRQLLENLESVGKASELPELELSISDKILMPMYWPQRQ